jgi:ribonuclease III
MLPSFLNSALLETALTHRSALNEKTTTSAESNERLEFLGDAVLELATTQHLYRRFSDLPEGILTAYRSALVKTTTLASLAETLQLGDRLYMSKGEEATGGRTNPGLLADTFEAVIGALYLDQGFQAVEQFLESTLFTHLDEILENRLYKDPKSELQEHVQSLGFAAPTYEVTNAVGPDHDKTFTVTVSVDGAVVGEGTGRSKQQAQQAAAEVALRQYSQS